jgi:uncharacterized protein (DUF779 family)
VGNEVHATRAALEVITRLEGDYGPLVFFQSGGCCDGTSPICLMRVDMTPGPSDVLLGRIGGAPFYIDAEQYERWGRPQFEIDVRPGAAEGFSLEGLAGVRFVTRTPTCPAPPVGPRGLPPVGPRGLAAE